MSRLRPVHRLTPAEIELASAIAPEPLPSAMMRARRCKAKIEAYWRKRGRAVMVSIAPDASLVSNIGPQGFPPEPFKA